MNEHKCRIAVPPNKCVANLWLADRSEDHKALYPLRPAEWEWAVVVGRRGPRRYLQEARRPSHTDAIGGATADRRDEFPSDGRET